MRRKICFFTSSRSEYGLLRPLINLLERCDKFEVTLIVSGTHLLQSFGNTSEEINLSTNCQVIVASYLEEGDDASSCSRGLSILVARIGAIFKENYFDLLFLLGDRYELLSVAHIASIFRLPIAHLHGGELTYGSMDDNFRHAITKLSHLHFVACEEYRKRVIQMGELPKNVINVGALAIENIKKLKKLEKETLCKHLDVPDNKPIFALTYHPETNSQGDDAAIIENLILSLLTQECIIIITGTNSDPGYICLQSIIKNFVAKYPSKVFFFPSLGFINYLNLIRHSEAVVGNSSSGILEAPYLDTPTINIGIRQKGRLSGRSIIHSDGSRDHMAMSIKLARRIKVSQEKENYDLYFGDGSSSEKILKQLLNIIEFKNLLAKDFYDINGRVND
ncbi:UDP-N-acetylglucosamine 2-epimerase [Paracoccaceae bacterium]|nr:UDP-N-acetylglucosamine 2-epimerase [Paracoccaceae bacterium]